MKSLRNVITTMGVLALVSLLTVSSVCAEGSKELNSKYGHDDAYRAYTEWDEGKITSGIIRTAKLSVYAKKGEVIYLGSSVSTAVDGKDIVVRDPSGNETFFDVTAKQGLISNYTQEMTGPNVDGKSPEGYTPFVYNVEQTGIYNVEFHNGNSKTVDPKPVKVDAAYTDQSKCVAQWDISVYSGGTYKPGRVFTSYLPLNLGGNNINNYARIHVLTKDGYDYAVNFNGIDPFGFIMYANNRGLIDATTQTSLYKTGVAKDNNLKLYGNVIAPNPNDPDTDKNITHRIFFNTPADDLPASIPTKPQAAANVVEVKFTGYAESAATVGSGGYFALNFDKNTTYRILLDLNNNGIYDGNDVIIADAASAGENNVFWNGLDADGKEVPAGTYNAIIMTKGGEYHFPLLDAESNPNGIEICLLNDPLVTGDDRYTVYYDNRSYKTADGTSVKTNSASADAPKPEYALSGVSSKGGAIKFTNSYGDFKVFDMFTYTPGNEFESSFTITEGKKSGFISGIVFRDVDNNGEFGTTDNGLANVSVKITCADGKIIETKTDNAGAYSAVVPIGQYTVEVIRPEKHKLTTSTEKMTGKTTLANLSVNLIDVGYNYVSDVGIKAEVNKTSITEGDTVTYTITVTNYSDFDATSVSASAVIPAGMKYISDTSAGIYDHETGIINISSMEKDEAVTFNITVQSERAGEFTLVGNTTCMGDAVEENNYTSVTVKAEAKPEPVKKPDNVPDYDDVHLSSDYAYIFGRSDTMMEPKDGMKLGEACAVLHRLLRQNDQLAAGYVYDVNAKPLFSNLKGRWDRNAIEYMTYVGVYDPNAMSVFPADRDATRGEAFKLICIGLGFTSDTTLSEDDYAAILVDAGYVVGYGDGSDLGLGNKIQRDQFCKIYNMIIGRDNVSDYKLETKDGTLISAETYNFCDLPENYWAYEIILRATSAFEDGYVSLEKRAIRNELDEYTGK